MVTRYPVGTPVSVRVRGRSCCGPGGERGDANSIAKNRGRVGDEVAVLQNRGRVGDADGRSQDRGDAI